MKMQVEASGVFHKQYMRKILLQAVREIAANPVLKKIIRDCGNHTLLDESEVHEITVTTYDTDNVNGYIVSVSEKDFEVQLPDSDEWNRQSICSPLSVVEVPEWLDFVMDEKLWGRNFDWLANLGANHMRVDELAKILRVPVETLMSLEFVAEDGKTYSAFCTQLWDYDRDENSYTDIRAILAALALRPLNP